MEENFLQDLGHKKKSVNDLIRFILNRSEKAASNFSIFLGAGASITSGVRSGQELIQEWEKEILEEEDVWKIRTKLTPEFRSKLTPCFSFNSRRDSRNFRAKPNRFTA